MITEKQKQEFAEGFGRWIEPNEIVYDYDSREYGFQGIAQTTLRLFSSGYKFVIWLEAELKSKSTDLDSFASQNKEIK